MMKGLALGVALVIPFTGLALAKDYTMAVDFTNNTSATVYVQKEQSQKGTPIDANGGKQQVQWDVSDCQRALDENVYVWKNEELDKGIVKLIYDYSNLDGDCKLQLKRNISYDDKYTASDEGEGKDHERGIVITGP